MGSPASKSLKAWAARGRHVVHESDTKLLLAEAGIAIPRQNPPDGGCVVKLASDRFPHKTEHGLVKLNVAAGDTKGIASQLSRHDANGVVIIEEMISDGVGEWIVGCRHDATFGPIVVVGAGGIMVGLFDDAKVRLAPVEHATVRRAIMSQRAAKILEGLRGKPRGDIDGLVDLITKLSIFFAENSELIEQIEINPVIVRPVGQGAVAADALMMLKKNI